MSQTDNTQNHNPNEELEPEELAEELSFDNPGEDWLQDISLSTINEESGQSTQLAERYTAEARRLYQERVKPNIRKAGRFMAAIASIVAIVLLFQRIWNNILPSLLAPSIRPLFSLPEPNHIPTAAEIERINLLHAQGARLSPNLFDSIFGEAIDFNFKYHQLRELANWRLPQFQLSHPTGVHTIEISPDGNQIAVVDDNNNIRLWNINHTDHPPIILEGHTSQVLSVAYTSDGKTIATADADNNIFIWDWSTRSATPSILTGHTDQINSLSFSSSGSTLASASDDQTIRLWDLTNPGQPATILNGHTDHVKDVTYSQDGETLISISSDETIRKWRSQAPFEQTAIHEVLSGAPRTIAFTPDRQTVAIAYNYGKAELWNLNRIRSSPVMSFGNHTDSITAMAFSSHETNLAIANTDNTIQLYEPRLSSTEPVIILGGHQSTINDLVFSPDGRAIASASDDATVRFWHGRSEDLTELVLTNPAGADFTSIAFAPDGSTLVANSSRGSGSIWNLDSPTSLRQGFPEGRSIAYVSDGRTMVQMNSRSITLWDISDPTTQIAQLQEGDQYVSSVAVSSNGNYVASAANYQNIHVWNIFDLEVPPIILNTTEPETLIYSIAISPDDKILAASVGNKIYTWQLDKATINPNTFENQVHLPDSEVIAGSKAEALAFSPNGELLAAGTGGHVTLFSVDTLDADPIRFQNTSHNINDVTFSSDGGIVASGSGYGTQLWHLASPSEQPIKIGEEFYNSAIAFSPDGLSIASARRLRETVHINPTLEGLIKEACDRAGRNLTWAEWQEHFPRLSYELTCPEYPVHPSVPANGQP